MRLQALLLALAALTQAAPHRATSASKVSARQDANVTGTVLMCTNFDFSGSCTNMTVSLGYSACTNLMYPWVYNISSFTPTYGVVCYLNHAANCSDECRSPSGCSEIVEYPGYANLSTYGALPWTDNVASMSCNIDYSET